MKRTALVVGGGIGGLATAIELCRAGWQVTVCERAAALPATGTGLGIWPEAVRILDRLGLGDDLRGLARRQASGVIRRPDGRRIATIDVDRLERRTGEPVYLLSRPALLRLLATALPPGTVRFGAEVAHPITSFGDYDVVIGADGIRSRLRTALFGERHGLRYCGYVAWRGTVQADIEAGSETWGQGERFGLTPQEPGNTNWYAVARLPEGYVPPAGDLGELRHRFGHWHDPIPQVLDRINPHDILRHELYYLDPPLPSFVRDNVVLLGDAAHAMTPDLGQGACQAMIDGLVLAESLVAAPDVPAGLAAYDRRRRRPAQRLAATSLTVNRIAGVRRFTGLRDAAVRAALAVTSPGG